MPSVALTRRSYLSAMNLRSICIVVALVGFLSEAAFAESPTWRLNSLSATYGAGDNDIEDQFNRYVGVDLEFLEWRRTEQQIWTIGASIAQVRTDGDGPKVVNVLSFFPQLQLTLDQDFGLGKPVFMVRALGPSWISENDLGTRSQRNHFAFHARVSAGFQTDSGWYYGLTYQHFSNAGLSKINEGWDIPLNLTISYRF